MNRVIFISFQSSTVQQLYVDLKKVYDSFMTEEVCNFPTELFICMELITVIKMCLVNSIKMNIYMMLFIENYLKQGNVLLFVIIALEYVFQRVQENQKDGKNGTHYLLVISGGVNILGYDLNTIKESTEALLPLIKILLCKRIQRKQSHCSTFNTRMQNKIMI